MTKFIAYIEDSFFGNLIYGQISSFIDNYLGFKDTWHNWDYIFEDVYTLFEDKNNHKLKTLKEKEDFFARHPWQLEEMLKQENK